MRPLLASTVSPQLRDGSGAGAPRSPLQLRFPPALRDRPWADMRMAWLYGSMQVPTVDQLIGAIRVLAAHSPRHRLFRRYDSAAARWSLVGKREIDDWIGEMVRPLGDTHGIESDLVREWVAPRPEEPLFRLGVGNGTAIAAAPHAYGDGAFLVVTEFELLDAAMQGRDPVGLMQPRATWPLARASLRQIRKNPRWLHELATLPPAVSGADSAVAPPASAGSPLVVTRRIEGEALKRLGDWRARHAPKASRASVIFALLRAVVDGSGLDAGPGTTLLMDSRRWLKPDAFVNGNLISALTLAPEDPYDPYCYHREMRSLIDAARPLAATAQAAVGSAIPSSLKKPRGGGSGLSVTMSHIRNDRITWVGEPSARRYATLTAGGGCNALSFAVIDTGEVTFVCAQAHSGYVDELRLIAMLDRFAGTPVHLLTQGAAASSPTEAAGVR